MNILYLCDEYPPCKHGGIGSVTQSLARELVKQGQQVFVLGFYPYFRKGKEFEIDEGVNVFRKFYGNWFKLLGSRHKFSRHFINIKKEFVAYTKYLKDFIDEQNIDIIETPDFNEAFRYTGSRFIHYPKYKVPMVVKLHGTYSLDSIFNNGKVIDKWIFNKEKYHIHNSTKVVAVSEYIKRISSETFDYQKEISVAYNGLVVDQIFKYSGEENSKTVVYAGRLSLKKGIVSLLKAWVKVLEHFPDAHLKIYGQSEIETTSIINSFLAKGIRPSVDIVGFITKQELLKVYESISCAVFPSYIEPFGMAPVEAMSVGCPVIFTKRATGFEIIEDGVDGLLIDPDNIDELANAIIWILTNKEEARKIGERGFEAAKDKFEISLTANLNLMIYRNIILSEN